MFENARWASQGRLVVGVRRIVFREVRETVRVSYNHWQFADTCPFVPATATTIISVVN